MAANTGASKRLPVKWIRDKAKSAYIKMPSCFICGNTEELELHHTHSITNLFEKWVKDNNLDIDSDEDILEVREDFINQHHGEIYTDVFTLCLNHHRKLHSIYGKAPELLTAKKQSLWINKQKDKFNGFNTEKCEGVDSSQNLKGEPSTTNNSKGSWLQYRV